MAMLETSTLALLPPFGLADDNMRQGAKEDPAYVSNSSFQVGLVTK